MLASVLVTAVMAGSSSGSDWNTHPVTRKPDLSELISDVDSDF